MKSIILIATIVFYCLLHNEEYAQSPDWSWAKSADGTNGALGYSVAVDASGDSYVTGVFTSPMIIFDYDTLRNANAPGEAIFLVKYDESGNVLWAKSPVGTEYAYGLSVAVNNSGNIYVTGFFWGSVTFGSFVLNADRSDIFLAKYDGNGIVIWAESFGGNDEDVGQSVATDGSGNVFVTGYFWSN